MHRERAHVRNQVVVAKAEATLADHDLVRIAGRACLVDHIGHFPGRQELAFLDVDGPALGADVDDEIGLAAQERRRLQHIDDRRHLSERRVLVHVGQHRHAELAPHLGEHA